ncbi:helix-turn-helix transcriptional regulator [Catenovulum maritimum]|uniref:AraC family transcriptional regulator n=1 Tax=Catenovulum maritimum TaxID=1513271 RepID=A0A0J8GM08_9ALTE|nr:AraC family transcriptional regulator [Catenovulum maritimum]KMT63830.1 AraC family transcriptional regulator [Catenovulum maritimum]
MKNKKVYCEPFTIEKGYNFEVHRVNYAENDDYSCFMHFHQVHEIIIFDQVDGVYFYSQGQSKLQDNDIVFTPSLETHDFELTPAEKSWHIIQFLPEFLEQQGLLEVADCFQHGMHLRLSDEHITDIKTQVRWLVAAYQQNPHSDKSLTLLKLLLIWISENAISVATESNQAVKNHSSYLRLKPVIDLFRHQACVDMNLDQAAGLCHLSPAYFSRMFKSVFRCNYSEYANQHKIYSAARMLSQTNLSITDISFELNFSSPSHFIALFKKQFGMTPKKYKTEIESRI